MQEPLFEIKETKKQDGYSSFILSPLETGFGNTLGVSLRRVLLTSLPGAAITKVKIAGVKHQFSTLKGMREDVVEFTLNLKRVRLTYEGDKAVNLTLSVKGPGEVKAGDIKVPSGVKVANPDLVLANLSKDGKLDVKLEAEAGTGYTPGDDRSTGEIGTIPLDASFSPVERVNYKVEETRVGRLTNYDKLIFEIWTDGSIKPADALLKATQILDGYLHQIISPKKVKSGKEKSDNKPQLGVVGNLSVEEIGLPTRIANALYKSGYETVEDLVKAKDEDLSKVRNLGAKSVKVIKAALAEKGVTLE